MERGVTLVLERLHHGARETIHAVALVGEKGELGQERDLLEVAVEDDLARRQRAQRVRHGEGWVGVGMKRGGSD